MHPLSSRPLYVLAFCFALYLALPANALAQNLSPEELDARVSAIFGRSCSQVGCHAAPVPQMELNLDAENYKAHLIGVPSTERPELLRIHPGKPDSSYLMMKLYGAPDIIGLQMPMIGDKLSEEEVGVLEQWIESLGADETMGTLEAPALSPSSGGTTPR